jgi:hypothetical protein
MLGSTNAAFVLALLLCACSGKTRPQEDAPAPGAAGAPAVGGSKAEEPLGSVLREAPLPIEQIIGFPAAQAESFLGAPTGKGGTRKSCVRHVPHRTWFHCEHAWQRYADKTGRFAAVSLEFEDGVVAAMAWEAVPGSGTFDPRVAARTVGLELPGEPSVHTPAADVTVWSYFNNATRLRIHGREYRVEVSTRLGAWEHSKVELILNDPLSEAEKARVFEVKPR